MPPRPRQPPPSRHEPLVYCLSVSRPAMWVTTWLSMNCAMRRVTLSMLTWHSTGIVTPSFSPTRPDHGPAAMTTSPHSAGAGRRLEAVPATGRPAPEDRAIRRNGGPRPPGRLDQGAANQQGTGEAVTRAIGGADDRGPEPGGVVAQAVALQPLGLDTQFFLTSDFAAEGRGVLFRCRDAQAALADIADIPGPRFRRDGAIRRAPRGKTK